MSWFLFWLTNYLPARRIDDGDRKYLFRFYLFTYGGRRYYLHEMLGSDPARGLHNHKWHAWSLILSGWYWEQRQWGRRKIRWFNFINPDTLHRIVLPHKAEWRGLFSRGYLMVPQPCWTLFSHRVEDEVKQWGFQKFLDDSDCWLFVPHRYEREGSQHEWWKKAPKGRELRQAGNA